MNSPANEPAVKVNETLDGIAGLSDVFILRSFVSIRSQRTTGENKNTRFHKQPGRLI